MAPAGTPAGIVAKLNAAINDGLSTPETKDAITRLGALVDPQTPQQFGAFVATELQKWTAVARAAKIKID